ncbi:MAG: hypothetical protein HY717_20160 [Planctomycetes bacterium]|nr:hypothetical protein [Planctomycetota bacterium]
MIDMTHLEHHLYHLLKLLCQRYEACTCSRETLCKMVGMSPGSKRAITDAVRTLQDQNLIKVTRAEGGKWSITLGDDPDTTFDMILWVDIDSVFDENEFQREFGEPKPVKVTPVVGTQKVEEDDTFKDEDFQFQ